MAWKHFKEGQIHSNPKKKLKSQWKFQNFFKIWLNLNAEAKK
jgi:hypothetical protein